MSFRRVLIVEDDQALAAQVARHLRLKENFIVRVASTLAEGLRWDEGETFDCLILDAGLPDTPSDFATVDRIKDFHAPIVVYSASKDDDLLLAVRHTGAAYVQKASEGHLDLLIEKVWSQINYRKADKESAAAQKEAQRRLSEPEPVIKESTLVALTLTRVLAICSTLVVGAVGVTVVVLQKVGSVDSNISSIGRRFDENVVAVNRHLEALDTELKNQRTETQARILEWNRWRGNVYRDIRQLGGATKTEVYTEP